MRRGGRGTTAGRSVAPGARLEPEELQGYWDALAVDAVVVEPLAASAWSAGFGMLTDRFGVTGSIGVTA